jgi:hypothetical protein
MKRILPSALLAFGFLVTSVMLISCEINSGNDTVRNVTVNIAGTYRNESGIPSRQSGAPTTRLSLTQSGDQLFGVDEHGIRWSGRITRAEGNTFASLTLQGGTTAGGEVTLTGTVSVDGTTARFTGIWIEPGFTSNFSAEASVTPAPSPTPTPQPGPTPSPTPSPTPVPGNGGTGGPSIIIGT